MTKYIIPLGLVLFLGSSNAAAAWSTSASIRLTQVEVQSTTQNPSGFSTWLGFTTMPDKRPACATSSQAVIVGSAEHMRMMTNLATAAFVAGKRVRVYWNNQCTNSSYGQITHLLVE